MTATRKARGVLRAALAAGSRWPPSALEAAMPYSITHLPPRALGAHSALEAGLHTTHPHFAARSAPLDSNALAPFFKLRDLVGVKHTADFVGDAPHDAGLL